MRHLRILCLLLTSCLLFLSCSKNNDTPAEPTIDVKNTLWAGEFRYSASAYNGPQPFSIELKADGTLTWSDLGSTRPAGTWVAKKDTIIITLPNGTFFSAKISGDNWGSFSMGPGAGFSINQVSRSAKPDPTALINSSWSGAFSGSTLTIKFTAAGKLDYTLGGKSGSVSYTVEGAGIRFNRPSALYPSYCYAVFLTTTNQMRGLEQTASGLPPVTYYDTWVINKQ